MNVLEISKGVVKFGLNTKFDYSVSMNIIEIYIPWGCRKAVKPNHSLLMNILGIPWDVVKVGLDIVPDY